jgi:hypothetical protein
MLALSGRECKPSGPGRGSVQPNGPLERPYVWGRGARDDPLRFAPSAPNVGAAGVRGDIMAMRGVRALLAAMLTGCVVAAAPAAVGAATRADTTTMLAATPNANLKDGQQVTVTGTGYPANAETDLVECEQGVGCDFSNLQIQVTDSSGAYTTTFFVRRILTLDSGTVDCVTNQDCVLVSLDISGLSTGAQTAITFDPNAPLQPPLHFRVTPDTTGHVVVAKGVARVTGTVECNRPVEIFAEMVLTQVYGRSIFQSETFVDITCDHGGTWAAVFRPFNGLFDTGAAKVRVDAFGFTTTSYEQIKTTAITLVANS